MFDEVEKSAVISECGTYRYSLTRRWSPGPVMLFVMLNPSTADAAQDDPTIRRCIGFARREGCGAIEVVNTCAFRATDPAVVRAAAGAGVDVVGPDNATHLQAALARAQRVVVAWGATDVGAPPTVVQALRRHGALSCLGCTRDGSPRHPLYVRADQPLMPWPS